jgi:hypothetical protein
VEHRLLRVDHVGPFRRPHCSCGTWAWTLTRDEVSKWIRAYRLHPGESAAVLATGMRHRADPQLLARIHARHGFDEL